MEYSVDRASREIGKRVVVSIRTISAGQEDQYSGYWGVIDSVHEGGFLVWVEGGSENDFEMIPPDFEFLQPAEAESYQFNDEDVVQDVDYEVYLACTVDAGGSPEAPQGE